MALLSWFPFNNNYNNQGLGTEDCTVIKGTPSFSTSPQGVVTPRCLNLTAGAVSMPNPLIPTDTSLSSADAWTISFWLYRKSGATGTRYILCPYYGTTVTNCLYTYCSSTATTYTLRIRGLTQSVSTLSGNLNFDTWYHITLTYSDMTLTSYINGEQFPLTFKCNNFSTTHARLCLGSALNTTYAYCYINDFRLYNHCLSTKEIKDLAKGLNAHLRFNFDDCFDVVEFIESTGTQWIDSGVSIAANTRVETKVSWADISGSYPMLYGAWSTFSLSSMPSGKLCISSGQTSGNPWSAGPTIYANTVYTIDHRPGSFTIKNVSSGAYTTYSFGSSTNTTNSRHILIFAASDASTGDQPYNWSTYSKARIYYFKIYNGNTIVRDFIPVVRKKDSKPGLFDLITNTFYTDSSSYWYTSFNFGSMGPVTMAGVSTINFNDVTFSKSSEGWGPPDGAESNSAGITSQYGIYIDETTEPGGFVSCTVAQTNAYIMIGFANTNGQYGYSQGYFVYPQADGTVHIYERGSHIGSYGSYVVGDRFIVEAYNHKIYYYKNGTLLRSVTVSSGYDDDVLYMNINTYSKSATVKSVSFWQFKKQVLDAESSGYNNKVSTAMSANYDFDTTVNNTALASYGSPGALKFSTSTTYYPITIAAPINTKATFAGWFGFGAYSMTQTVVGTTDFVWQFTTYKQSGTPLISLTTITSMYVKAGTSEWSYTFSDPIAVGLGFNHFALVIDDTSFILYHQGSAIATSTKSATTTTSSYIKIGCTESLTNGMRGSYIKDFRAYATALTADDIKDLYNTGAMISDKGQFSSFELNEVITPLTSVPNMIRRKSVTEARSFSELAFSDGDQLDTWADFKLSDGSRWVPICVHNTLDGYFSARNSTYLFDKPTIWSNFAMIAGASRPESSYYEFLVVQQQYYSSSYPEIQDPVYWWRFKQSISPFSATNSTVSPSNITKIATNSGWSSAYAGGLYWNTSSSYHQMCFANTSNSTIYGCGALSWYSSSYKYIYGYNGLQGRGWQVVYMRVSDEYTRVYPSGAINSVSLGEY